MTSDTAVKIIESNYKYILNLRYDTKSPLQYIPDRIMYLNRLYKLVLKPAEESDWETAYQGFIWFRACIPVLADINKRMTLACALDFAEDRLEFNARIAYYTNPDWNDKAYEIILKAREQARLEKQIYFNGRLDDNAT